jgi:hypothetical protein
MTYATGSRILASDYNTFCGASAANVSTQLNTVLGTGRGNAGYGQTIVSNVAVTNKVLASHWNSLITGINTVRKQQNGAGFSNLSSYTTGTRILANANVSGNISSAYSNRLSSQADGTTIAGSGFTPNFTAPNDTNTATFAFSRIATFASGDAARYFFNAGGQIKVNITSVTNVNGTSRSTNQVTTWATNLLSKTMRARSSLARTGTGGTVTTDLTGSGFWNLTTSNVIFTKITTASATYSGDYAQIEIKTNGTAGSYAGNGSIVTILLTGFSALQSGFDDAVSVTVNYNIEITYPETTYLANSWSTVTVT